MDDTYTNVYQAARLGKGLTQERAALLLGVSVDSLKAYEGGRTKPKFEVVRRMANTYDAQYLFAEYANQSEVVKEFLPKITTNEAFTKVSLKLIGNLKKIAPEIDEFIIAVSDGEINENEKEFVENFFGKIFEATADALAVKYAKT